MGRVIAQALGGELDVVLTRKLHAPGEPEFAIGAVDEHGWCYFAEYARSTGADDIYIKQEVAREVAAMRRSRALYTPVRPPIDPAGRIVIVVDDGVATGATMIAALHSLRSRRPERLVCAVPVAAPGIVETLKAYADEVVCLETPANFYAVSQFYRDFRQVDDEDVIAALAASVTESRFE